MELDFDPSLMLHPSQNIASDLRPVNRCIQLFIQQSTDSHVLSTYQIEPMGNLLAIFRVILRPNDALDCFLEDQVGQLVAGKERAGQRSAICCKDEDFLCRGMFR